MERIGKFTSFSGYSAYGKIGSVGPVVVQAPRDNKKSNKSYMVVVPWGSGGGWT